MKLLVTIVVFLVLSLTAPLSLAQKILHLKNHAYVLSDTGNSPLARGQDLKGEQVLVIPAEARIFMTQAEDGWLEIVGPARLLWTQDMLKLEYGRFLFLNRRTSSQEILLKGVEPFRVGAESVLEIELPPNQAYSVLVLHQGRQKILGAELAPNTIYVLRDGVLQTGPGTEDYSKQRRDAFEYSWPFVDQIKTEAEHISYRNQMIFSLNSHLIKLSASGSDESFQQSTFGFAGAVEWNHKRYMNLAKRPQRIHYLKAPAYRLGLGTQLASSTIQPTTESVLASKLAAPYMVLGASWLSASVESVWAYPILTSEVLALRLPLQLSPRARYEWDLREVTESDIMFSLGYSYSMLFLKASSKIEAQVSSPAFRATLHGVEMALHFNF